MYLKLLMFSALNSKGGGQHLNMGHKLLATAPFCGYISIFLKQSLNITKN